MPNEPGPVIIIGAGPAGITAAYELRKKNIPFVIIEKEPDVVGGIARTVRYKEWRFDIGGHRFFSKSERVMAFWQEILGVDFLKRPRLSRIFFQGKFWQYPIRPFEVLRQLGWQQSTRAIASYLRAQLFPRRPEISFRDYIVNRFGEHLYRLFFKTYTEKVWGLPCEEIQAEWAAQRIKGVTLRSAVLNAIAPKRGGVKSFIEEFYYPRLGPGMMWKTALARALENGGGQIFFNSSPTRIIHQKNSIIAVEINDASRGKILTLTGRAVISSMPISQAVKLFDPTLDASAIAAGQKLRYRDFILVALILNRESTFADNWVYVHDPTVRVGRIQNFINWSPDMVQKPGTTCLGLEYFVNEGDQLWTLTDAALIALASTELARIGFARPEEIMDGCVVRVEKTYPVYDEKYAAALETIRRALTPFRNFYSVGRNGLHRYNNQDHSMLTAMYAVENIGGATHDIWQVNAERVYHETHQESR
ncbi:MAG: NAD(P)/FAD-dependent oxidoreductase [Candidatus Magasanikbacteria bacterium]|nr:NAD(P)/FAD-dependent oxidoreductase [Candidatus Magasanikbacteria bacterium]